MNDRIKQLWHSVYFKLTIPVILILTVTLTATGIIISQSVGQEVSGFGEAYERVKMARLNTLLNNSIETTSSELESIVRAVNALEGWEVGFTSDGRLVDIGSERERMPIIDGYRIFSGDWFSDVISLETDTSSADSIETPEWTVISAEVNRRLILTGLIAGIAGIILIVLLLRKMLHPLGILSSAAQKLGEGDLSQRIIVTGHDEISRLGTTFNVMATGLESSEQQRRNMMADIAHELRTPLFNVQGYLEGIRDGTFDADEETIDILNRQVVRLSDLVEDVRTLTLAESRGIHPEFRLCQIGDIIKRCTDDFQPQVRSNKITLTTAVQPGIPPVRLDETRIAQVVENLIRNALFHTPSGGTITVSAENTGNEMVRITVSDTGTGIAEEDVDRIFDRFYKADKSRTGEDRGSGLGLTIARELVKAHGGTIRAESTAGKGTSLTVELPF